MRTIFANTIYDECKNIHKMLFYIERLYDL